jgi:hypothetical protein
MQGSPLLDRLTLVRVLRGDRLLLVLTLVAAVVTLLPLTASPFLPFADLPGNVGQSGLLWDAALGNGVPGEFYKVTWKPLPYWSAYVFMTVVNQLFGAVVAAKAMVAVLVLALPLATMRLLVALGRSPRVGLFAFILSWEHSLYGGWVTFLLGMSFALWALAWLVEARTTKAAAWVIPLSALIALTHILAVAYLLAAAGLLTLVAGRDFLRRLWLHGVGVAGCLIAIGPWLWRALTRGGGAGSFNFDLHSPAQKVASLFKYTLDNDPDVVGGRVTALVFAALVVALLVLAGLRQLRPPAFEQRAGIAILLAAVVLYLVLPMGIGGPVGHWYTYPRYATYVLIGALIVPAPELSGARAWWLGVAMVAVGALDWAVWRQLHSFGERAAPFVEIMKAVKPNTTVLPLELEDEDPSVRAPPFNQFHGYLAADKAVYDPHLFDNADIPVAYRPEMRLPMTAWDTGRTFTLEAHGKYWNYVLVQGASKDPVVDGARTPEGQEIHLVKEAGRFRLYEVSNPARRP